MARVVVLGSSGFDLTVRLDRIPRPGETRLGGELLTGPGGKGANAAVAARRAGADVLFLTAYGDDDFGRRVRAIHQEERLDLAHARVVAGTPNQVALIFVDAEGCNAIAVAPGASARLDPETVEALPAEVFGPDRVLLACLEVPVATVAAALRRARSAGMTTVLNPAPADRAILEGGTLGLVDVLTPNQEEARALTGVEVSSPATAALAAARLREAGARAVVVTLGEAGCFVSTPQGDRLVPGYAVATVDTVGAGDAFNGVLATALAEGKPLPLAASWANAAGALAVTKPGAQGGLPHRPEIDRLIADAPR